ncbi:type III secretion system stator protein SctL [Yersinia aldovae]|uniref:type III secretion system stator protein SctL n=1 Tax=Yersinia aldovae TaxID=29483 RepID=UPI0005ABE468|nr:type III secretion system stator protein SctL [Yersinia aldovae]AJJ62191.1 type III secretion apparatus protein, HrpE/YscL family [Yersinia aldovae 670-83]
MSRCRIPLTEFDWQPPATRIIPAMLLEAQYRQAKVLNSAEKEAAAIINAARRKAEGIIREAHKTQRQMQTQMRQEQDRIRQETLSRCEAQWLQTHVTALLQDEAREKQVVRAVSARIQRSLEQVLSAWFDQQPIEKTLCGRLARQAEQMACEGALTLHIHPSMQEAMLAEFGARFTLVPEADFTRDRAVLASPQLSVAFSLSNHFQQLLTWLRTVPPETGDLDENSGYHTRDKQ